MACPVCSNEFCSGGCAAPTMGGLCTPGAANVPITDQEYRCSVAANLQCSVDAARRQYHLAGFRPYRVTLIWQRRNSRQRFEVFREIELTPVNVETISQVDWRLGTEGRKPDGDLLLTQVSPAQVTENDLIGRLDGDEIPDDTEFFYEIQRIARCVGSDTLVRPGRYTVAGMPEFDAAGFQWVVAISDQRNYRQPEDTSERDRDATFKPAAGRRRRPFGKMRR